jgi:secondary thiamine-phosphate synthase enzyme
MFTVKTDKKIQVLDITEQVRKERRIFEGTIIVYIPHTTAALVINENERNLKKDMEEFYDRLTKGNWAHDTIDNNAASHLMATTLNSSLVIPVKGDLLLGTWQSILFVELDGPREREVVVTQIGK